MTVTGDYNEAFSLSDEMDIPHGDADVCSVKTNDYEVAKSMNTYDYCSKLDLCSEMNQIESNGHCIVEIKETKSRNTYSTYSNDCNTCEDLGYPNSSCLTNDEEVEGETISGYEKSSSHCAVDILPCNETISKIFYNYDINKISPNNTKLTSPVPDDEPSCCECETSGSVYEKTTLSNSAPFTIVKDDAGCCGEQGDAFSQQHNIDVNNYGSSSLIRSLTEHSIKSCKEDELPSYRSLIAFRLQDSPPNYESVTGIRVNVDEVRKDVTSFTRNRLRREVRTCSDLNSSAKRLLVLMAAIIIAICIVMIILTI